MVAAANALEPALPAVLALLAGPRRWASLGDHQCLFPWPSLEPKQVLKPNDNFPPPDVLKPTFTHQSIKASMAMHPPNRQVRPAAAAGGRRSLAAARARGAVLCAPPRLLSPSAQRPCSAFDLHTTPCARPAGV